MMRAVAEVTRPYGVPTFASLNAIMLDGTGMCGGCRVQVGGKTVYACVDGPEFDAHAVDFRELADRLGTYREFEAHALEVAHRRAAEKDGAPIHAPDGSCLIPALATAAEKQEAAAAARGAPARDRPADPRPRRGGPGRVPRRPGLRAGLRPSAHPARADGDRAHPHARAGRRRAGGQLPRGQPRATRSSSRSSRPSAACSARTRSASTAARSASTSRASSSCSGSATWPARPSRSWATTPCPASPAGSARRRSSARASASAPRRARRSRSAPSSATSPTGRWSTPRRCTPTTPTPIGRTVAIVGSGPAGLTAAKELVEQRLRGHDLRGVPLAGRGPHLRDPRVPAPQGHRPAGGRPPRRVRREARDERDHRARPTPCASCATASTPSSSRSAPACRSS